VSSSWSTDDAAEFTSNRDIAGCAVTAAALTLVSFVILQLLLVAIALGTADYAAGRPGPADGFNSGLTACVVAAAGAIGSWSGARLLRVEHGTSMQAFRTGAVGGFASALVVLTLNAALGSPQLLALVLSALGGLLGCVVGGRRGAVALRYPLMRTRRRGLPLVPGFLGLLLLADTGACGIVRGVSSTVSMPPAKPVDVSVVLTVLPGGVRVQADLSGTGLTAAALRPSFATRDTGYVLNSTERTTGTQLRYTGIAVHAAADGLSAQIEYDVQGDVVYPVPVSQAVSARRLVITVSGGRIASCLTAYGTSNGTPRLRPCQPATGAPLALAGEMNGLERVRLTVTR